MAVPSAKYAPIVTLHGEAVGLDNAGYLVGTGLSGAGFRGFRSSIFAGQDYKLAGPIRHTEQFDDFNGPVLETSRWTALTGSDGTNSPVINLQAGGVVRLTTGAGATHTMAVNGSQFCGSRNWLISNGGTVNEVRLGNISALTSQSICFGLIDAVTLSAPFTRTTVTTTANGTNGACFLQDAASTNTHLYAVAVNAGGTPQSVALGVDVDTAAFHKYRIEIDAAGNAAFYVDGLLATTILLAVATTSRFAPSVGMFSEATSGSQTLDVDYSFTQNVRV